ncbi:phosphotransferase enzyme family protein [Flavivirga sp. 57AJ16]|uniref:phosphotransferase enzyme family protein n=1 Tax=Flavivirga sp. 57AJ16 TaxID=3025307 RepID=UPI002365F5EE|nr:aminoglycoside phosphotransferase family protein [Flavivirga sp. 57AJ16]MDD7888047.1 aminoglycoside phosphotransferase family protein [Flavivirga sp. 57AJ16]
MLLRKLETIFNKFNHKGIFDSYQELASGHINDTYLIITKKKPYFILQRINHEVFKDVRGLIENKVGVSRHLQKKLGHLSEGELKRRVLSFVDTNKGDSYYKDGDGNYWNMMYYIDNSQTFDIVTNKEVAYEGGKLSGEFLNLTSDFNPSSLIEIIPKFHDMSFRYSQFEDALKVASKERLIQAKESIDFVEDLRKEMHILQSLKESGDIKLRVTHNDTKISNALFDLNNKGLCVIDTDTVMPGIVHYDFGDAIRTICNTASEDEKDLSLVTFNLDYYEAYVKGFLETLGNSLTPIELKYLPLGAKSIIFIMGLRFLTDFLNGDVYYKIEYPEHNLVRSRNQFKLVKSFSEKHDDIQKVMSKYQ